MVTVQTTKALRPSSTPFEEIFKTSYSHGLEQIYALETIDITKVKRIEESLPETTLTPLEPVAPLHSLWDGRYQLDLGDEFRGWVRPFFLEEPIQVLGLSQRTEIALIDNGKRILREIVHADLKAFISLKGVGQGHIDEIQKKLKQYIAGRSLDRCFHIEFAPLVRALSVEMDRKQAYLLLESYQLERLLSLNPAERMEFLMLKPETKKKLLEESIIAFRKPERAEKVHQFIKQISHVFLVPWMRGRGGVTTRGDLEERLERVAEEPGIAKNSLEFLSKMYFGGKFPFRQVLAEVEADLYCSESTTAEAFINIRETAKSYFYKADVTYKLEEMIRLLVVEFGKIWEAHSERLINAALRKSSLFRVRKGPAGEMMVYLSKVRNASCLRTQASHS